MKLDAKHLRYLSTEDFRTLLSIELGMRNHGLVPTTLIERLADLRHGGTRKCLKSLARKKLIHHDSKVYDGYKLTYLGYDYLALNSFQKRGSVVGVGGQIGVGKESDISVVIDENDTERVLKLHRLGRISFRTIKNKRDYLKNRKSANWLYLSKLAAMKEYAFMKALYDVGYPVPEPIDQNRHCVVMERIDGHPLYQFKVIEDAHEVGMQCLKLIVRLAEHGLIHGDFNEFNLMLKDDRTVIVIDFPQMVSTDHRNADMYFDRDVECVHTYFRKKHNCELEWHPKLSDVTKSVDLDVAVSASGFSKEKERELRKLQMDQDVRLPTVNEGDDTESDEDDFGPIKMKKENVDEDVTQNLIKLRSKMEKVYEREVVAEKAPRKGEKTASTPAKPKEQKPTTQQASQKQSSTSNTTPSTEKSEPVAPSHPVTATTEAKVQDVNPENAEASESQESDEAPISALQEAIIATQKAKNESQNELLQQLIRMKVKRSHDARRKREKHTQSSRGHAKKGTKKMRNKKKSTKEILHEYSGVV